MKKYYLWLLRPYFHQVAGELVLGSLSGILMNTFVVLPAIMLGRAIDVTLAYEKGQASLSQVAWAAAWFLLGSLATQLPRLGKRWWLMTANARIRANLRADALQGVLKWPMERIHDTSIGELMARIVGDVELLGSGIHDFTVETWDTVLFSISVVVALLLYDPQLTLLVLIPVPFAMLLAKISGRQVIARTRIARQKNAALTSTIQEQLAGLRVIRLYGRADEAVRQVRSQSQDLAQANTSVALLREGMQPVYSALMAAGILLVIAFGGQRVISGALSIGAFVAYCDLFLRFTSRAYRIPRLINSMQSAEVAYNRIKKLLAPPPDPGHEPRFASFQPGWVSGLTERIETPLPASQGPLSVRLKRVNFRYPDASCCILQDIDLSIPPGSLVAITGPVGCGKSTLLRAILGLYPLEDGELLLNGEPVDCMSPAERIGRIGYLHQDPYLFSGAIQENIAFGVQTQAQRDRVAQAVQVANLGQDIGAFPSGINTEVGEMGLHVSGGQRQRIAFARSLAAPAASPGLLLLDDPFSAVDLDTEARLIASLREAFGPGAPAQKRATILMTSHRLAAFPQADLVIVLNQGRVCETGTHTELLSRNGLYARIYSTQGHITKPEVEPHSLQKIDLQRGEN